MVELGVKAVIFRRGRVLLLQRRSDLAIAPGLWDMPGGGVEAGETLEGALVREVREETGFAARIGRPIHVWISHARFPSGKELTTAIVCYESSIGNQGEPRLDPEEHTEYAWVTRLGLKSHPMPPDQRNAVRKSFGSVAESRHRGR